ncbi:hypothetical protein CNY89_09900, partial [Amaricoccus sp. HAR-UPW-R2A-40]
MSRGLSGVLAVVGACLVWGLSGIYFKALAMVPPRSSAGPTTTTPRAGRPTTPVEEARMKYQSQKVA